MNAGDRARVLVTVRLLEAATRVDWLSLGLTLLAAWLMLSGSLDSVIAFVLGIVARYYAVRIAFDARLLQDVAAGQLSTEDLDVALGREGVTGRSWTDRCRGARRLVVVHAVVTLGQCVALFVMAFA